MALDVSCVASLRDAARCKRATQDVWFQSDIRNTLIALNQANGLAVSRLADQLADPRAAKIYRDGYCDALHAVAVAVGIAVPSADPRVINKTVVGTEIEP